MADFRDHFSAHAAEYSAHRPAYPQELFSWLAQQGPASDLAWDCATGNGQVRLIRWPLDLRVVRKS